MMTVEEWTTAYELRFGAEQAIRPSLAEGELRFLEDMWSDLDACGLNPGGSSAITLIGDELLRRRVLVTRQP